MTAGPEEPVRRDRRRRDGGRMLVSAVRMEQAQIDKLRRLGGGNWIRAQIDAAPEPQQDGAVHVRLFAPGVTATRVQLALEDAIHLLTRLELPLPEVFEARALLSSSEIGTQGMLSPTHIRAVEALERAETAALALCYRSPPYPEDAGLTLYGADGRAIS